MRMRDDDLDTKLVGDRWAYAQADHFTALAGMYGEGAVLVLPAPAPAEPAP
jgi:hypothetical protein